MQPLFEVVLGALLCVDFQCITFVQALRTCPKLARLSDTDFTADQGRYMDQGP